MDVTWTRGSPHWMGRGLQVQARVQAEAGHQDGEHTDKTWPSSLCLGCAGRVLAPAWCPACAPPRPWLWPDTLAPWADVDNGLWTMSLWPEAVTARRTRLPVAPARTSSPEPRAMAGVDHGSEPEWSGPPGQDRPGAFWSPVLSPQGLWGAVPELRRQCLPSHPRQLRLALGLQLQLGESRLPPPPELWSSSSHEPVPRTRWALGAYTRSTWTVLTAAK